MVESRTRWCSIIWLTWTRGQLRKWVISCATRRVGLPRCCSRLTDGRCLTTCSVRMRRIWARRSRLKAVVWSATLATHLQQLPLRSRMAFHLCPCNLLRKRGQLCRHRPPMFVKKMLGVWSWAKRKRAVGSQAEAMETRRILRIGLHKTRLLVLQKGMMDASEKISRQWFLFPSKITTNLSRTRSHWKRALRQKPRNSRQPRKRLQIAIKATWKSRLRSRS